MVFQDTIKLAPQEKGATDITELISSLVQDADIKTGTCQLFVHNSLSSLLISDTADESTKNQTADFLAQLAPSSDETTSIIDNSMDAIPEAMSAAITQTTISFPVKNGKPLLGTWQGIYLWEKTSQPKHRKLTITIVGE
ncbi:secondary thiamine-phosphate synthase enzyme YjbQ [bacterium]|jgi:secondary thiamine-phosphate synthase enzyme|nr:secondary thiamine-phosphate synthase enzyme YjbQ [bacterium]